MSAELRSLGALMLVIFVIICIPTILKGLGAMAVFLLQCIAAIIIGYILIAIVVGLLMMIFNVQNKDEEGTDVEKAWKF
jgi:hypothetical protein